MAFRKRNVVLGRGVATHGAEAASPIGVRPSPLTSRQVTSTGTPSLDDLLGGHAGLPLGSSILVEESGTTDYAGALLKYFAAEGICQGHILHVAGIGHGWVRDLPGVAEVKGAATPSKASDAAEKMKIAWRYERLGQAGERAQPSRSAGTAAAAEEQQVPFCHTFDLTKRLKVPPTANINHIPIRPADKPFDVILQSLNQHVKSSAPGSIHRLIIPVLLSPAVWPPSACLPENLLRFLHALKALLRQNLARLTAMITLPLELLPRGSGLLRWAEVLSDGVVELTPFPHSMDAASILAEIGGARSSEEQPQGMVKVHKLPISTERGEGGSGACNSMGEDLAFTVSRRKFVIKPFSLPPLEGDQEAQKDAGQLTGRDLDF